LLKQYENWLLKANNHPQTGKTLLKKYLKRRYIITYISTLMFIGMNKNTMKNVYPCEKE